MPTAGSPPGTAGRFDAEGLPVHRGRPDDVIVRGGENIAPAEIEGVLPAHPAMADAIAVLGIPDPEWGETVAVVVDRVAMRLGNRGRAANVGAGAVALDEDPTAIEFRSELLYSPTGKPPRRASRDQLRIGSVAPSLSSSVAQ